MSNINGAHAKQLKVAYIGSTVWCVAGWPLTKGCYRAAVASHVGAELRQLLATCVQLRLHPLGPLLLCTVHLRNTSQTRTLSKSWCSRLHQMHFVQVVKATCQICWTLTLICLCSDSWPNNVHTVWYNRVQYARATLEAKCAVGLDHSSAGLERACCCSRLFRRLMTCWRAAASASSDAA